MQLILEITPARISAFEWNDDRISVIASIKCLNKTDMGYKASLEELMLQIGDLQRFQHFSCSFSSSIFTLVPQSLFSASNPNSLLQFTSHRTISKGEIDYNRLPEWGIVSVYHMPMWVKSVLILKIPQVVIQHEISHILRKLQVGSLIPNRTHIILHESAFSIVIRYNGVIFHASVQEFQAAEDVVYHLLLCYQRMLEIPNNGSSKSEIQLHSTTDDAIIQANQVQALMQSIPLFDEHRVTSEYLKHLQFQTLCV